MPALAPVMTTVCVIAIHLSSTCQCSVVVDGVVGQGRGALQHQRVRERLGQVAAQLALPDVVFLAEQSRGSTGGPVALEPAHRAMIMAQLMFGERHHESTEQEGAFGVAEVRSSCRKR